MNKAVIAVVLVAALLLNPVAALVKIQGVQSALQTNARKPTLDLCPTCVQFTSNAIDELLNIIANVGIIGSCGALCSMLPNQIEATVCNLLCDIVGIDEFVKLVQKADLDPIYFCELLKVCPIHDGGSAAFLSINTVPPKGPQGTTFEISAAFQVYNQTGTGEIAISIFPPDGEPFGDAELNEGFAPGSYGIRFQLQANPSEQEPFSPGVYKYEIGLCNGECGSKHPHSAILAVGNGNFTITA
jgi:hypothetical protein